MPQQDCPSESEILDLAEGRLASEPRQRLLAHLDECEECRQVVSAIAPEIAKKHTVQGDQARAGDLVELRSLERDLRPGRVVSGRYRIEHLIGQGGMGAVFAAHHVDLDKRVAFKVVRSNRGVDEEAVSRLLREAKAAAALGSEHVVGVLDAGRLETGDAFVVYEYLEGHLARVLATRGPLEVAFAADLVLGACEALAVAHARGIVHRDIKPANLFLTERADGSPLVKVLDFGIAKVGWSDGAMTSRRAILGSPRYMAPEQLRSSATVDARADVWSLGVTLFELVSGKAPFQGDSVLELCAAIATEPPRELAPFLLEARPAKIDAARASAFAVLVASCLEKKADDRCPDVGALAAGLEPFATDEGRASARRVARIAGRSRSLPPGPGSISDASSPLSSSVPSRLSTPDPATASTLAATFGSSAQRARPGGARRWAAIAIAIAVVVFAASELMGSRLTSPAARATTSAAESARETAAPVMSSDTTLRDSPAQVTTPSISEAPSGTPSAIATPPHGATSTPRRAAETAPMKAPPPPSAAAPTPNAFHRDGLSDRH